MSDINILVLNSFNEGLLDKLKKPKKPYASFNGQNLGAKTQHRRVGGKLDLAAGGRFAHQY